MSLWNRIVEWRRRSVPHWETPEYAEKCRALAEDVKRKAAEVQKLSDVLERDAPEKIITVRLHDGELDVICVPKGARLIVHNHDERDPYRHDGGDELGAFSTEIHDGPILPS